MAAGARRRVCAVRAQPLQGRRMRRVRPQPGARRCRADRLRRGPPVPAQELLERTVAVAVVRCAQRRLQRRTTRHIKGRILYFFSYHVCLFHYTAMTTTNKFTFIVVEDQNPHLKSIF